MPMKLLVFGKNGQVGSALTAKHQADLSVIALDRDQADLRRPDACSARVEATDADVVVNAAAMTDMDAAEADDATALMVNARAPGAIAAAARRKGLPLIQLSTDYVFPGTGSTAWRETDLASPINVYGATKRLGEQAVLGAHPDAVILRTSWIFSERGRRFGQLFAQSGASDHQMAMPNDRIGCPTPAEDVVAAVIKIAAALRDGAGKSGIFHFCGTPAVTLQGFARAVLSDPPNIAPRSGATPGAQLAAPAERPRFSVLNCNLIRQAYGITQPDWRHAVKRLAIEPETEVA